MPILASYRAYLPLFSISLLLGLGLSACDRQKTSTDATDTAQPVTINEPAGSELMATDASQQADSLNPSQNTTQPELQHTSNQQPVADVPVFSVDEQAVLSPEALASPEAAIQGTQISAVEYVASNGQRLKVVFETAKTGTLHAKVTLPDGRIANLTAPADQGNNPTYRSADGNIELVSHAGGSVIDLIVNGTLSSFEVVSVEAEVVRET